VSKQRAQASGGEKSVSIAAKRGHFRLINIYPFFESTTQYWFFKLFFRFFRSFLKNVAHRRKKEKFVDKRTRTTGADLFVKTNGSKCTGGSMNRRKQRECRAQKKKRKFRRQKGRGTTGADLFVKTNGSNPRPVHLRLCPAGPEKKEDA
jgi:hypothetical protein